MGDTKLTSGKELPEKQNIDAQVTPVGDRASDEQASLIAEDKFEVFKVNVNENETAYRTVGWYVQTI